MARKRMISPEIWESQNFSALSDVSKIVFISLFSHADDEGRGKADPTFVKNTTFPYDEGRRVADIKIALSEIARSMSVQFYSVNGIEYYVMTNWERWQKVEKPSKSKLPPPPIVGEGGDIHSAEKFPERSPNIPRTFPEAYPTNRIEKNISKYPPISPQEGEARGKEKERFLNAYPKLKAGKNYDDRNIDYKVLYECFARSAHLRGTYSMKWVCANYDLIAQGVFDDDEKKSKPYQNDAGVAADMRGARERYYAALREQAIDDAEKVRKKALSSEEFKRADEELKANEIAVARAEVLGSDKLPFLLNRLEEVKERRRNALQAIGIKESDLLPNYTCKKCLDTGFMKDGRMCDCYKKGGTL